MRVKRNRLFTYLTWTRYEIIAQLEREAARLDVTIEVETLHQGWFKSTLRVVAFGEKKAVYELLGLVEGY